MCSVTLTLTNFTSKSPSFSSRSDLNLQTTQALPVRVLPALHEESQHPVPAHEEVQLVPSPCQRDLQEGRCLCIRGEERIRAAGAMMAMELVSALKELM